jgi:hypothetical protein
MKPGLHSSTTHWACPPATWQVVASAFGKPIAQDRLQVPQCSNES